MSQIYSPEEAAAVRRAMGYVRSTSPSSAVLEEVDEIEKELDDEEKRVSRRKRRATESRKQVAGAHTHHPASKAI